MNRNEFMDSLSAALRAEQEGDAVEGLLADFNDHFDEALRDGQTEAEICRRLGDPVEIAAACREELGRSDDAPPDGAGIYISLDQMDLLCQPSEDDEFHVEVRHNNRVVRDDTVRVTQTQTSLQVIQTREQDFVRRLFHTLKFMEVDVKIPRRFSGDMAVKMTSGNARLDGVPLTGSMRCELTSGNLNMLKVSAGEALAARLRSGNVEMENCRGELEVECRSGNIKIKSHKGNVLRAAAASGNVKVEADSITKDCAFAVKSGNLRVELERLDADLDMECHSGNIQLSVKKLGGNITGKTHSGNITASLGHDTRAVFLLQSSGMRNPFPNAASPAPGVPVVNLTSRSGNINIKEL